jgi:LPS sulfotransferase NodH
MRGYVVCATPRSGSNYLCQLLASTGLLGTPREYFNAVGRRKYDDPAYPQDPHEQLSQVLSTGATSNGVWGVKLHPFQLVPLLEEVDPFVDLPHAAAVWIRRRDRLGQAVSWVRAQQTGQHRAGDQRKAGATYRTDLVDTSLAFLAQQDASWAEHLAGRDVRVLEIAYEDLHEAPQRQVDRVAELLGVPGPVTVDRSAVSVRVQRDDVTEEWRERYLADRG